MIIGMNYRRLLPHGFGFNKGVKEMDNEKGSNGDWTREASWWAIGFDIMLLLLVIMLACTNGACGGSDDDTNNCQVIDNCPDDPDGGTMADADDTAPDADDNTTPDGNTDACSAFDQPSPTGNGVWWGCTADNGSYDDCENPTFTVDEGQCYAVCEDGSSAGKVESSDQTSTWHYFTTITPNTHFTCRPL